MTVAAILVAAGRGERAGGDTPKQYRTLAGKTVADWSLDAFRRAGINQIVAVVSREHAAHAQGLKKRHPEVVVACGGDTRTASVRAGLAAAPEAQYILVHDAARPGLSSDVIERLLATLSEGADAVAPALSIADTLLRVDETGRVLGAIDRVGAMRVQTPQAFQGRVLRAAYNAASSGAEFTDDLAVASACGYQIKLIGGDPLLKKITHPGDFALMERLLAGERLTCVGHGVDAHRFGAGDHVMLCGVRIAHDRGLLGHSDADAGWHALVDAILGALGEGDIGAHFPPSDPRWKGAASEAFLRHAVMLATQAGARINHVDVTLICERPKIGPHREAMRRRTAEVLGVPPERVSVKATTTEKMGFTGRGEGLAAQATATLDRPA